jgi:hypothetical protein
VNGGELVEASAAFAKRSVRAERVAAAIRRYGDYRWVGIYDVGRDEITAVAWDGPGPPTHPRFPRSAGLGGAAVETATGVPATVIGKPEPYVFLIARDLLRTRPRIAVVGDNLASDIAGAKRAGLDAILVLTGTSTCADVAGADYPPDLVVDSIADLARHASRDVRKQPECDQRKQARTR